MMEQKAYGQQGPSNLIDYYKKLKLIKILLSSKFLLAAGIVFLLFLFIAVFSVPSVTQNNSYSNGEFGIGNQNLSDTTLRWLSAVEAETARQGVPELVPYIMAMIEVESRGLGTDIMQSGESAGLGRNGFTDPLKSIEQGVSYLKSGMQQGEMLGFSDVWAVIQSYNFGLNYVSHLATRNKNHDVKVAKEYSRSVVAPSLGNRNGQTYSYVNAVSLSFGDTYLYRNGGNYYYAELIRQYITFGSADLPIGDGVFQTVMNEALKYNGWSYVWGGDTPTQGFDCSGLTQWSYKLAGIHLPRTALEQYRATVEVPLSEARPGDLVFFRGTYGGPNHVSHVGIYLDENRMYDSNGSGVGYSYWNGPYWSQFYDSVRRVVH